MEIQSIGDELLHEDRDRLCDINIHFSQFCESASNEMLVFLVKILKKDATSDTWEILK
jgi:hypothetical protein